MRRKQLVRRAIRWISVCLLLVSGSLGCSNERLLSGIVDPDAIDKSETIRHGVDTIHVFKIDADMDAMKRMTSAWKLEKVSTDEGMSFLNNNVPAWWPDFDEEGWGRYSQADNANERYWSVWYSQQDHTAYVEIGQW